MVIPLVKKIQLRIVSLIINWQNFALCFFNKLLFAKLSDLPRSILIFKVGNIGDIICAVPALIAVRRNYPQAKITLLTSPGKKGAVGAKELLEAVWYLDELKIYYQEDIANSEFKKNLIKELREKNIDLFIQIPDDWVNFRTLLRNMFFAKMIGAKSAFGFKVRTILNLFKKTQIDYTVERQETEFLLDLLKSNGIQVGKVEFSFNIIAAAREKVKSLLEKKFNLADSRLIGICPGGKGVEKHWPAERFAAVAHYLKNKYHNAKFIIFGGPEDIAEAEIIKKSVLDENVLIAINKINLIESFALLKYCEFLLTNDTGIMHIAAAIGKPTVALFSIRNILGKWFPYGNQHKILYHKFLNCDYKKIECMKKSLELISVEEVISSCEELIKNSMYYVIKNF
jgi:heptosyltransferase-2